MPISENIEAGLATTPTPPTNSTTAPSEEPQAPRELTQTDHLNRRLLKSLLDSMAESATQNNEDEDNDTSSNNDFEE